MTCVAVVLFFLFMIACGVAWDDRKRANQSDTNAQWSERERQRLVNTRNDSYYALQDAKAEIKRLGYRVAELKAEVALLNDAHADEREAILRAMGVKSQ